MTGASLHACLHIVSRAKAKEVGLKSYFTGKPCKAGHVSQRSVCSSNCLECLYHYRRMPSVAEKAKARAKRMSQDPNSREQMARYARAYHQRNRDVLLAKMKERNAAYYAANKDRIKDQVRAYQAENSDARREYKAKWIRQSRKNNPDHAAIYAMRKLISRVCERIKVGRRELGGTVKALGYTSAEFKLHIERQFLRGMSWKNRSEWHIDHIIPLSAFDLTSEESRRAANSLANLRPMWAKDNMSKSDKITSLL